MEYIPRAYCLEGYRMIRFPLSRNSTKFNLIAWQFFKLRGIAAACESYLPTPAKSAMFAKISKNSRKYRQATKLVPV